MKWISERIYYLRNVMKTLGFCHSFALKGVFVWHGKNSSTAKVMVHRERKKTDTANYTCAVCLVQTGESRHTTITPDITSHKKYTARNIPFLSASGGAAPAVLLHWATKELKSRDFVGVCSALLIPHPQLGVPSSLQSHDEHTCCCSAAHPEMALHLCSCTWSPVSVPGQIPPACPPLPAH